MATVHSALAVFPCGSASLSARPRDGDRFPLRRNGNLTFPCLRLISQSSYLKASKVDSLLRGPKHASGRPGLNAQWRLVISAAQATETIGGEGEGKARPTEVVEGSLKVLKEAAETKSVAATEVLSAILKLKEAKVDPGDFLQKLGGASSPGREWQLVFTSSSKDLKNARQTGAGGGMYFPIDAAQTFDAEKMTLQNGAFLGPLGSLIFKGRFTWKGRMLAFIFDSVDVSVGPLGPFSFNTSSKEDAARTPGGPGKKDPFFLFDYVDDELVVAQGRGGGVALWSRKG